MRQAVPADGRRRARALERLSGPLGRADCILAGAYCDLSRRPKGPSFQTRYDEPDAEVDPDLPRLGRAAPPLRRC